MDDDAFNLPVTCKGQDLEFAAKLIRFGYSYKIEVDVNGTAISFEPDEERNWRALIDPEIKDKNKIVSSELLQAIVTSLDVLTK